MSSIARQYEPIPDLDVLRLDTAALVAEGRAAFDRLLGWLDGADPSLPVPGLTWTVHDVAAHLATDAYLRLVRGQDSPFDLDKRIEQGAAVIESQKDVPLSELTARIKEYGDAFLTEVSGRSSTEPALWHSGEPMTVGMLAGTMLNEAVLHGMDVARAIGAKAVHPRRAAALGAPVALASGIYVYRPTPKPVDRRIEVRIRGAGAMVWHFLPDRVRLEAPGGAGKVDLHISADPVVLLQTSFGRIPRWRAVLSGGMVAWGRHPGAASLVQRFETA
jgi:uncharacterized protein (TIGR03083 family)